MEYDNVVFCKINGEATIAKSVIGKNKKNQIIGMVFQRLSDGKRFLQANAQFTGMKKNNIEVAHITGIRPLKGLLTELEIIECINSCNKEEYIESKMSK